jgi:hypothetical protein
MVASTVAVWSLVSVNIRPKLTEPGVVGVPLMVYPDRVRPAGNDPLLTTQVPVR